MTSVDTRFAPYTDDSIIRKVNSEGVLLLGGGRALLMQIAHPAVAAGVAAHSSFRTDPLGRLLRTLRPTLAIAFGAPHQVERAAASINAVHERVIGPGYNARDPALLLWVLATLIDTGLLMHERFLRPLSPAEADAYYADVLRSGELIGLRREDAPPDLAAFRAYVTTMLDSLEVSPVALTLSAQIFAGPPALTPAFWTLRQLTAGLLPPRLRDAYNLAWGPKRESLLNVTASLSSVVLPHLPKRLRRTPAFLLPPREPAVRL